MQKLAVLSLAAFLGSAAPSLAQGRVPDAQMMAAGVDAGVLFPGGHGLTVGAGIDYFIARTATVKFEGRYDWVKVNDGRPDPLGISLTVGLKKFF